MTENDCARAAERLDDPGDRMWWFGQELRTSLSSIQGHLELLLDGEFGSVDAVKREVLARLARNAGRVSELVVDLERILATHTVRPLSSWDDVVHMGELARAVVRTSRRVERRPPPEVFVDARGADLDVRGDRRQLTAILSHAITSVTTSTARRGRVLVSVHRDVDHVQVSVHHGRSTAPKGPWVRLRHRMSAAASEVALGLSIASSVVATHGGTLSVDDSRNGPVRVVIRLPAG